MIKLLESIFAKAPTTTDKFDAALIHKATDRLVEGTDPRLIAVNGYRERLRPAVERTVEYVIELVDSLTLPADLARRNYLSDPRFRAFFSSVEHLREKVAASQEVTAFLNNSGGVPSDPVHAMLAVRCEEHRALGMQLEGDAVRRDVMHRVFNFHGHQFLAASTKEDTSRLELKRLAYDELVSAALARMVAAREERHTAMRERKLLEKKLRCLRDGGLGLGPAMEASLHAEPGSAEREIVKIELELSQTKLKHASLEDYLNLCVETLSAPEAHIRLQPILLTIDQMGRKVEEGSSSSARTLSLQEITISDRERAIVLMVRIDPAEIPPPRDFIKEARRYLG